MIKGFWEVDSKELIKQVFKGQKCLQYLEQSRYAARKGSDRLRPKGNRSDELGIRDSLSWITKSRMVLEVIHAVVGNRKVSTTGMNLMNGLNPGVQITQLNA